MTIPHAKFIVAGTLIVAGISYLMFSGLDGSMVYYHTLGEIQNQEARLDGKGIRVSGHVQPGSIQRDDTGMRVQFLVYERETQRTFPVAYTGMIPDTFKDDAEVVVEGTYHSGAPVFEATTLLAKCPSKYESQGEEHPDSIPVS